jgi:hypothetical protein
VHRPIHEMLMSCRADFTIYAEQSDS